jgi:hypothetical protein
MLRMLKRFLQRLLVAAVDIFSVCWDAALRIAEEIGQDLEVGEFVGGRKQGTAAGGSNPLDRPDAGEGGGREPAFGATYPRSQPTRAAPHRPSIGRLLRCQLRSVDLTRSHLFEPLKRNSLNALVCKRAGLRRDRSRRAGNAACQQTNEKRHHSKKSLGPHNLIAIAGVSRCPALSQRIKKGTANCRPPIRRV